eukprot:NODE_170_length_14437_cov_1.447273.p13 type:complete len:117 gc:universal NODE_170_length_14437_cov_1.447273:12929-13279(+)
MLHPFHKNLKGVIWTKVKNGFIGLSIKLDMACLTIWLAFICFKRNIACQQFLAKTASEMICMPAFPQGVDRSTHYGFMTLCTNTTFQLMIMLETIWLIVHGIKLAIFKRLIALLSK